MHICSGYGSWCDYPVVQIKRDEENASIKDAALYLGKTASAQQLIRNVLSGVDAAV